jgi:hypothetical protein
MSPIEAARCHQPARRRALAFEPAFPNLQLCRRRRPAIDDAICDLFARAKLHFQFSFVATASDPEPEVLTDRVVGERNTAAPL